MSKLILLDSGPLGIAANTRASETTLAFNRWLYGQTANGIVICVPEVSDSIIFHFSFPPNTGKTFNKITIAKLK